MDVASGLVRGARLAQLPSQDRTIRFDLLPGNFQAELIETAEHREIGHGESSVRQVEIFQTDGVRTRRSSRTPVPRRRGPRDPRLPAAQNDENPFPKSADLSHPTAARMSARGHALTEPCCIPFALPRRAALPRQELTEEQQ